MRILHLTTAFSNGAGKAARRLNEALNKVGVISEIATSGRVDGGLKANEVQNQKKYWNNTESKLVTLFQSEFLANSSFPLTPISIEGISLSDFDFNLYDIIHIHATYNYLSIRTLVKLKELGKPLVITLHDERFLSGGCHNTLECKQFTKECGNCPLASSLGKIFVKRSHLKEIESVEEIASSLHIVSPSSWMKDQALLSAKLKGIRIVKLNNPIPEEIYNLNGDGLEAGTPRLDGFFNLGFAAANVLSPFKGLSKLMNAVASIPDQEKVGLRLIVIGEGNISLIPKSIPVLHLKAKNDEEMARFLRQIDLMIAPSVGDNSPSVVSESLMCGTKVIGSNRGGIPEMLGHDRQLIFDVDSTSDIAKKIIMNRSDYDRKQISALGTSIYSYSVAGDRYRDFYSQILI